MKKTEFALNAAKDKCLYRADSLRYTISSFQVKFEFVAPWFTKEEE